MIEFEEILLGRASVPLEERVADNEVDPSNVMPETCPTCPWREDEGRLNLSPEHMKELLIQVLSISNQRCHAPALNGKPETRICRKARDIQLVVFHRLGVLTEPTDEAWAEALAKIKEAPKEQL